MNMFPNYVKKEIKNYMPSNSLQIFIERQTKIFNEKGYHITIQLLSSCMDVP